MDIRKQRDKQKLKRENGKKRASQGKTTSYASGCIQLKRELTFAFKVKAKRV